MQRWIDKAVRVIVAEYAPDRIILFGSCATGQYTRASDIDLLIVKPTDLPYAYRGLEIMNHLARYPVKYDLLFYTPDELACARATEYSFIDSILKTGKILV